jgi:hypothetical protein
MVIDSGVTVGMCVALCFNMNRAFKGPGVLFRAAVPLMLIGCALAGIFWLNRLHYYPGKGPGFPFTNVMVYHEDLEKEINAARFLNPCVAVLVGQLPLTVLLLLLRPRSQGQRPEAE